VVSLKLQKIHRHSTIARATGAGRAAMNGRGGIRSDSQRKATVEYERSGDGG